jgi:hypothetical protein
MVVINLRARFVISDISHRKVSLAPLRKIFTHDSPLALFDGPEC